MTFIHDSEDPSDSAPGIEAAMDAVGAALSRSLPPDQEALT